MHFYNPRVITDLVWLSEQDAAVRLAGRQFLPSDLLETQHNNPRSFAAVLNTPERIEGRDVGG